MTMFLKIMDFILLYVLIGLWLSDFFSMRVQGKASTYVSELLKNDASRLRIALENPAHLSESTQAFVSKKVKSINRWYWLGHKNFVLLLILGLQQWLVMTAKQNWGLVTIELIMLVVCGLILAADLRVNRVRIQLEKELKPYEDRLWFEYRLRS